MKTVGILGAGQLGCMLAASLQDLGATVHFFDPDTRAPGRLRTPHFTSAPWTDAEALRAFFAACDVVTYEFENIDRAHLAALVEQTGTPLLPSHEVLAVTQERDAEKAFLADAGLPCAPFLVARTRTDLEAVFADPSVFPFVAKTLAGGYDGKGQAFVRSRADFDRVLALLPCILEEAVPLAFEASVVTARDTQGRVSSFPVFENIHTHHVLDTTLFPSPHIAADVQGSLIAIAEDCATRLGVIGLLTTEFFLSRSPSRGVFARGALAPVAPLGDNHGDVLYVGVNEFAPRPHNSGHVTLQACFVSQFDAHARVLLGLPVPKLEPISGGSASGRVFAMGNLLGDVWLAGDFSLQALADFPDVKGVTLYGKETVRAGRKMGHFTLEASSAQVAMDRVKFFRARLSGSQY